MRAIRITGLVAAVVIAAAPLLSGRPVHAGWTTPVLLLTDAAAKSGVQEVFVHLAGSFHEADLVQIPYPIQILIRNLATGDVYVRYSLPSGVFFGRHAPLIDGLDQADAISLFSVGTPSPDGRLLLLGEERIRLLLPASFPDGEAEVQLFVVTDDGRVVRSNSLLLTIPAAQAG